MTKPKHTYFLDTKEDMNTMSTCNEKKGTYASLNGVSYKLVKPSTGVGSVAIWEDKNGFQFICLQV